MQNASQTLEGLRDAPSSSRSPGAPSLSVALDRLRNASGGTALVGQWLRVCFSTTGGTGSIPGQETKILHAVQHSGKKKKKWLWFKEDRAQAGSRAPMCRGFLAEVVKLCLRKGEQRNSGEPLDLSESWG